MKKATEMAGFGMGEKKTLSQIYSWPTYAQECLVGTRLIDKGFHSKAAELNRFLSISAL